MSKWVCALKLPEGSVQPGMRARLNSSLTTTGVITRLADPAKDGLSKDYVFMRFDEVLFPGTRYERRTGFYQLWNVDIDLNFDPRCTCGCQCGILSLQQHLKVLRRKCRKLVGQP